MRNLRRRGERIDEHCPAAFACGERRQKHRGRRQKNRRAFSAQRSHQRCAALQQRQTGRDKLLHLVVVDGSTACGEGERKQGKGVEHVVFGLLGFWQLRGE